MKTYKAPDRPTSLTIGDGPSVFLAGAIDQGKATDWQTNASEQLTDYKGIILNPRRDDWDDSWEQTIDDPNFREQVEWELEYIQRCDHILMHFPGNSEAPITLLEFGLNVHSDRLIVCCESDYFRRGNIEVVCNWFNIPLYDNIDDGIKHLKYHI